MDHVTTGYQALVKDALSAYVEAVKQGINVDYDVVQIFDDETQQYMVLKLGWQKNKRLQHIPLHVALRDGKIWIEADWTEEGIATYFLERGVPNQDIVLGFQAPAMRPFTEFAVA